MIGVVATAGPDGSICEGGTFALSGASAQNYASVSWTTSGSGVFNDPAIVNPVYTPGPGDINAGQVTLTMTVTAPGPCNPVVDQVLLAISKGPVAYAGPDAAVCPGVSYTVSGASATNYTEVSWTTDGNGVLTGDSTLNPTYTPAPGESGTVLLFLTATGTAPCNEQPARDTMKITVHLPLTVSAGPDQTIPGMTTATLSGTAAGGSGVYAFSWEPKELLVGFTTDHPGTLQLSNDAQFTLTVTDLVTGCSGTDVVNIIIGSQNLPPVAVDDYDTTGVNVPVIIHILSNDYDPDGQINTVVLCGGPYNGGAIINIDRSLTYQPDFNFKGNDSLCYIICDNGNPVLCDTAMVYININTTDPASRLEVYNMISPNGDGSNDRWIIDGIENYPENNVKIFNRWGDRIFAIDDYNNTTRVWEGTDSNGKNVPDGTYYYILTITNGGSRTGWIFVRSGN
jgi:gliding motility-associated-like protein